ncbi:MAG: histidinol dehydrogenase, partial [Winogradskyella sp.]|nr:histidinol dehydrogenase [Winogradskyella sp.]
MKLIENPNKADWSKILERPTQKVDDIEASVNQIFEEVSSQGDKALRKYTSKFDGVDLESFI